MKSLKTLSIVTLVAMFLICCENKKNSSPSESVDSVSVTSVEPEEVVEDHTVVDKTEGMKAAVQEIYSSVMAHYSKGDASEIDFARIYYTESLQELVRETRKLESATGKLCVDWDLWVMAQDFGSPSAKVESACMTGEDKGVVKVEITDGSDERDAKAVVVMEHGQWKIDDLLMESGDKWVSVRKLMSKFTGM